ncbi:MAG: VCBS repeat-containing protein [Agrobacterium sp.]|nr:VCBS repeat-containing protein [Agrobacterium sp.]
MPVILGIAIRDLDGDGREDFVVHSGAFPGMTENTPQGAHVFWQQDGGYRIQQLPNHRQISARATTFADFNGDGLVDLFFAGSGWDSEPFPGEQNYLFLNTPGGFVNAGGNLPDTVNFSHGMGSADVDGDGDIDIVINAQLGNVKVAPYLLINDGAGNFTADWSRMPAAMQPSENYGGYPYHRWSWMTLGDLDGDGLPELIAGKERDHFNTRESLIYFNTDGQFADGRSMALPNHPDWGSNAAVVNILVEDFNGDGANDIVMLSYRGDPYAEGWSIQLLQNDGRGNMTDVSREALEGPISNPQGVWLTSIRATDINNDGYIDIVAEAPSGGYLPTRDTPLAWLGNGKGRFIPLLAGDILGDQDFGLLYNSTLVNDGTTMKLVSFLSYDGEVLVREKLFTTMPQIAYEPTNGNDIFRASPSVDIVDGLSGRDTFVFTVARPEAEMVRSGNMLSVTTQGTTDRLTNIERLQFTDGTLAFDTGAGDVAGSAYRLYQAAFDRVPDKEGLGYWISEMDKGIQLNAVADSFINSPEFHSTYGSEQTVSNAKYVELLYTHTLGRNYDQVGFDYWVGRLDANATNRGDLLAFFSESNENQARVAGAVADGIWYV